MMSGVSESLSYASSAFKWRALGTLSTLVRSRESLDELALVSRAGRIADVDEVMREAEYSKQSWTGFDTFPSPGHVAYLLERPGKKIGDCQSFAVLAAAMLEELPPEEGIERVEIACARLQLPTRKGGHAVCLYKRKGKWGIMQQGGRLGAFDSREQAVEALARSFKARLLWWCRLDWPSLTCIQITRCA